MPQIDRKISCETLAEKDPPPPPEPFFPSAEAELDWIDRNAFVERNGTSVNLDPIFPIPNPPSDTESPKPSPPPLVPPIIEPPKPHQPAANRFRLFPKRSSCMGRARSRRKRQAEPAMARSRSRKKRGFWLWASFRSIFRRRAQEAADPPPLREIRRFSSARRSDANAADFGADAAPASDPKSKSPPILLPPRNSTIRPDSVLKCEALDPPCLGAVRRFSSARRSDAWAADLQGEGAKPSDEMAQVMGLTLVRERLDDVLPL